MILQNIVYSPHWNIWDLWMKDLIIGFWILFGCVIIYLIGRKIIIHFHVEETEEIIVEINGSFVCSFCGIDIEKENCVCEYCGGRNEV